MQGSVLEEECRLRGKKAGRATHLGAVAGAVDREGMREVGRSRFQRLARVGHDQLAQLARVAERDRAQPVLDALRLNRWRHLVALSLSS